MRFSNVDTFRSVKSTLVHTKKFLEIITHLRMAQLCSGHTARRLQVQFLWLDGFSQGTASFPPQPKYMHFRLTGNSKLSLHVDGCVYLFVALRYLGQAKALLSEGEAVTENGWVDNFISLRLQSPYCT